MTAARFAPPTVADSDADAWFAEQVAAVEERCAVVLAASPVQLPAPPGGVAAAYLLPVAIATDADDHAQPQRSPPVTGVAEFTSAAAAASELFLTPTRTRLWAKLVVALASAIAAAASAARPVDAVLAHIFAVAATAGDAGAALVHRVRRSMSLLQLAAAQRSKSDGVDAREQLADLAQAAASMERSLAVHPDAAAAVGLAPASALEHAARAGAQLLSLVAADVARKAPDPRALQRFIAAQARGDALKTAVRELRDGRKASCWIWYVCPQFLDPGRSSANNTTFQIQDQVQAVAYLLHARLSEHLAGVFHIIAAQLAAGVHVSTLMGHAVDAKKLHHSCSTFLLAAESVAAEDVRARGAITAAIVATRPDGGAALERVAQIAKLAAAIIERIRAAPYNLPPATAAGDLPQHDPVMLAAWARGPSWVSSA
jgi:uncharacterized protein (DUF1810 family)